MNTDYNSYLSKEETSSAIDSIGSAQDSQYQILPSAAVDAFGDNGIAVADWKAGFMLGSEGNEFVEIASVDVGELQDEIRISELNEIGEDDLLYVEEEESLALSLTLEQSATNEYFDAEAFYTSTDLTNSSAVLQMELEPFLESNIEGSVNLDVVFDAVGVSANRVTDESLFMNDPLIEGPVAEEPGSLFGEASSSNLHVSFDDLDLGKVIDQMVDQMLIYNES